MKAPFITSSITVLASLLLPMGAWAEEKPKTPAAEKSEAAPAEGKKEAATKALPFKGQVAAVDASAKTFTTKNKDGKENVFSITEKTKIEKADGSAGAIEDIKVDEMVRGTRLKLSDGKWEVVKVILGAKKAPAATEEKPAGSM